MFVFVKLKLLLQSIFITLENCGINLVFMLNLYETDMFIDML